MFMNEINLCSNYNFFFLREFQPMTSAPDDSSLSSDQDTNLRSLIQPSETLPVELTGTHNYNLFFKCVFESSLVGPLQ